MLSVNFDSIAMILHKLSSIFPQNSHCVKSVRIWSYSGPHFPAFALNTERYGVFLHIQAQRGKMRTRITPNTETFQAMIFMILFLLHAFSLQLY